MRVLEGHKGGGRKRQFEPEAMGIPSWETRNKEDRHRFNHRSWATNIAFGICAFHVPIGPDDLLACYPFAKAAAAPPKLEVDFNFSCQLECNNE